MKTWAEVAQLIVKRISDYSADKGRETSRIRLGIVSIKRVKGMPDAYPMSDFDWQDLSLELSIAGGYVLFHISVTEIGLIEVKKTHTWTKLGLSGVLDSEEE